MTHQRWLVALLLASLAGCKPAESSGTSVAAAPAPPPRTPAAPPPPPLPPYTLTDWRRDVQATYKETSPRVDKGEGITEFTACFPMPNGGKRCAALANGQRDAFRKVTSLEPIALFKFTESNYVLVRAVLLDCRAPMLAVDVEFSTKSKRWLFFKRLSVLADGEVILEHEWAHSAVTRNNESDGLEEKATAVLTAADVAALRKLVDAKQVFVRLTGDSTYLSLTRGAVAGLREAAEAALIMYDRISAAVATGVSDGCQ